MKFKLAIALASVGIISATAFGATSANWAVKDDASPFGVKIGVQGVVETGFYISINDTPTFQLEDNGKGEYVINIAKVEKDDQLKIYDADNKTTFYASLDEASVSGFTDNTTHITCNEEGYYFLCLKPSMGDDKLYIGTPIVTYSGYHASTADHDYTFQKAATGEGHKADYSVSLSEYPLSSGDRVDFYGECKYFDEDVSVLINHNISPNPDDIGNLKQNNLKPTTSGGKDFTVLNDTDGTLYFNINNDDSYGFWLTDGPDILTGYWLQVDGVPAAKFAYDKDEGGFSQYKLNTNINKDSVITILNADTDTVFPVKLDSASSGFELKNDKLTCTSTNSYDLYLKLQYGNDQIYIEPTPYSIDVLFTLPNWDGTLDGLKIHYWPEGGSSSDAYCEMDGKKGTAHIKVKQSVTKLNMCVCFKQNGTEKWSTNVSVSPENGAKYQITSDWVWVSNNFNITINKI